MSCIRIPLLLSACFLGLFVSDVTAQTESPPDPAPASAADLEKLRLQVEAQNRQIEALTREVIRLSRVIETGGSSDGPSVQTGQIPLPRSIQPSPPPKAQPVQSGSGRTHTVLKGETLTAIAKRYGTTVDELVTVNKISDDRFIQIGQVLILPESAVQPSETAPPNP